MNIQTFLINILSFLDKVIVPAILGIAFLFFIWNITRYFIFQGGDEKKHSEARQYALWSILAFVFILSLWGIVSLFASGLNLGQNKVVNPDYMTTKKHNVGGGANSGVGGIGGQSGDSGFGQGSDDQYNSVDTISSGGGDDQYVSVQTASESDGSFWQGFLDWLNGDSSSDGLETDPDTTKSYFDKLNGTEDIGTDGNSTNDSSTYFNQFYDGQQGDTDPTNYLNDDSGLGDDRTSDGSTQSDTLDYLNSDVDAGGDQYYDTLNNNDYGGAYDP